MSEPADDVVKAIDYPSGSPNVAQARADEILADAEEVMYGGALGGGKTDWLLSAVLRIVFTFPGCNALVMRRTFPELEQLGGIIQRLKTRIPASLGNYHDSKHLWTFANGSKLQLGHLNRGQPDLDNYLGGEYAIIAIDQADEFEELWVDRLASRLRVSGPLRKQMEEVGYTPRLLMSANPGGIGHAWLKRRFVDPFPKGNVVFRPPATSEDPNPRLRAFVPARVFDNLDNIGEDYLRVLNKMDPDDRRALRDGDWNVYKGQRFATFTTATHVRHPEHLQLPPGSLVPRFRAIDYGTTNPFVCLWGAILPDDLLVVYREISATGLTPKEQAEYILESETDDERGVGRVPVTVLDPACWAGTPDAPRRSQGANLRNRRGDSPPPGSIADSYRKAGIWVRKADNRRVDGAAEVEQRLRLRDNGQPSVIVFSNCVDLIRTLPHMQRDPKRPEDVLKNDEDHWYDAFRYLSMQVRIARVVSGSGNNGPVQAPPRHATAGLSQGGRPTAGLRAVNF